MPTRTAEAEWQGNLKEGKGTLKMGGSAAFEGPYSFASRFEQGPGTNPEQLIAAAHAACYSMAFSHGLASSGFTPKRVHTTANVHLEKVEDGFAITRIELNTEAEVPGIDEKAFQEQAEAARIGCPISKALSAVKEIKLNAKLL